MKVNSNLKIIITSLAIALSSISQPANAQNYNNEVPEIGWSSRLSSMGLDKVDNIGKTYEFYCQPAAKDFRHAPIWGTNIYTVNSGICSTAVHSGALVPEAGGIVTLELLEGREFYTGSNKNDVESKDYRSTSLSFTLIGEATQRQQSFNRSDKQQRSPSTIERVVVNGVQRGVERTLEKAIEDLFN